MTALDKLLERPQHAGLRGTARAVMLLLLCFLLWASFAELEEVAVAEGEVVPQEQIQAVQHLEGGIVEEIRVFEGDRVEKGQPLIQLNITPFLAGREELQIQLQALQLKKARIEAEIAGRDGLEFGADFAEHREALKASELQAFEGRRLKQHSELGVLRDQVRQRQLDIEQLQAERKSIASNLEVLREKLRISSDLMRDRLTPKLDHLQLKSEVQELDGRLKVIDVAIPRAQSALAEAEERLVGADLTFRNQAQEELTQAEREIAGTTEALSRAADQVKRLTITSPIAGVIKSLKTHTIGGVVQPGETIMEIVPVTGNLLVEARLNPNDIGFVKVGQDALVKILTYDYARYGGLNGKVASVSADSHTDRMSGESYFLVKVRTERNFLGADGASFPITAGMQATVDIKTGSKSVMSYLLKPVLKVKDEAFRER